LKTDLCFWLAKNMKSYVKKRMFNQISKIKALLAQFFRKVFYIRKINHLETSYYFETSKTILYIPDCDNGLPAFNVFRDNRFDGPGK
jgi:hypothetical protein